MHTPEAITGTVLLVDRSDRLPKQQAIFEEAGFTVLTAHTAEEGVEVARAAHPSIVISEVMLEKPDAGFVLGYKLKKDEATASIPVVLLSSIFQNTGTVIDMSSPEARRWIKADAYLERPVSSERLIAKVNSLLQHPHTN